MHKKYRRRTVPMIMIMIMPKTIVEVVVLDKENNTAWPVLAVVAQGR